MPVPGDGFPRSANTEVCVLGAGPAGIAVATRLSARGRDVLVLDVTARPVRWDGETFTGAIRGPLTELGCWDRFERARHVRGHERQSAWGGEPRVESSVFDPNGALWHVERERFDADLRAAAGGLGIEFASHRRLVGVRREAGRWRVELDGGREVRAGYPVDASGRRRALGRRLGSRIERHDLLIALTCRVARGQAPAGVRSMLVQSARGGAGAGGG